MSLTSTVSAINHITAHLSMFFCMFFSAFFFSSFIFFVYLGTSYIINNEGVIQNCAKFKLTQFCTLLKTMPFCITYETLSQAAASNDCRTNILYLLTQYTTTAPSAVSWQNITFNFKENTLQTFLSFASVAINIPSGENERPVGHV